MNEASSKFVDILATEKLLNEKLAKVSHSHLDSFFTSDDIAFSGLENFRLDMSKVKSINEDGSKYFTLPTFIYSEYYKENNPVYLYYYPAQNPERNILFLHGLFDDNIANYTFQFKLLNELKFNVFLMVLPYHYNRKPCNSLFSGEYFFSADIYRTRNAFKQAVYDIEASFQFVKHFSGLPSMLVGFSMGGCISLRYHLLKKQAVKLFLINPVTDLTRLIWDNALMTTVGRDLEKNGFDKDIYYSIFKELDPCENVIAGFDNKKAAMVYSIYDQIIDESKYKKFIGKIDISNAYPYSAGHLNILRVPKLSKDICEFFEAANINI